METNGGIRHPLNPRAVYTASADDTVTVTVGGRWGRFRKDGQWLEGAVFEADPELCLWVAAPRPKAHHRISRLVDVSGER